ncbi:hypothetical protein L1280_000443 [Deinococcus sp. HSC-46F16]|uniref:hypothetical protein n=1 Tax=Deinococcus sp. HSC-46F16 TaxID=2910968 RepID=UPI00209C9CA2|nr:hypothetical protein [Deinococcus sp. HSC-46F16]MCP2013315.1 hypothetical protein [Deinococcus sp. HSC-46F16]
MDLPELVAREGFPPGTQITTFTEPGGRVFRAVQPGRGFELLLTDEAMQMYGEGPTLALVLGRLREAAEAGLPPLEPGQTCVRQTFVGD